MDALKEPLNLVQTAPVTEPTPVAEAFVEEVEEVEEIEAEEVTSFAEILPATPVSYQEPVVETPAPTQTASGDKKLSDLTKEELFEKLQNYKKLLDNGLILQGEYDTLKKEILTYM
jgi:hypothetical protein